MAELKKCPFCGSDDIKVGYFHVWCANCGVGTTEEMSTEKAIEAWNNRVTEAEIRAKAEHTYENCHNLTCRRKCQKDGYNMAIDEFAEKLKQMCADKAIGIDRKLGIPLYMHKDGKWHSLIDDVAEQLKEE